MLETGSACDREISHPRKRTPRSGQFNDSPGWIITFVRFLEVLRQANGIVAGTSGLRWRRFLSFNALGAALWVGTWVSLGYLAGAHIGAIYHGITQYSAYLLIALVVALTGYIGWHISRRRRRATAAASKPARADQPQRGFKTNGP